MSTTTKHSTISADGISIFYREAGERNKPAILLLHGFPSSSFQFRNLIPLLATKYHIYAPDLPSFGFTQVPKDRNYQYTFDNFAKTILAFTDAVGLDKYAVYVFDYGAPTGLRMALERPDRVSAIVSQNGNAYVEGMGVDFWKGCQQWWKSGSKEDRESLRGAILTYEATKWQYEHGTPDVSTVAPETYTLDWSLLSRPGMDDIQLDIFYDYQNNVKLYPKFQEYFKKSQVPLLAVWGKNDVIFVPAGAEAFKKDIKAAEVHLLDAGHFASESNTTEIADLMLAFLKKNGI
jgi:pimeloyl-ACP methyl ester carboxylesterase